jgi:hypothetical protein
METVLFTSTFCAGDPATDYRFQLALDMCRTAKAFGYSIMVVDGSPDPSAKLLLLRAGATVQRQMDVGMGASRRQALATVSEHSPNAKAYVWLEPEKVGMIPGIERCVTMLESGYDIVVPWRNRLFTDYPHYQALSEARGNQEMSEVTGLTLDLYCGPRIMTRRGAEYMLSYAGCSRVNPNVVYDDSWGLLFVPILWALADGLKVGSCPVDYIHPAIQTQMEGGNPAFDRKRDMQREVLVAAIRQEATLLNLKKAA